MLEEQRAGHTRARDVMDIEARLLELYRDQSLAEKPALLDDRGGAFYSEAAAQLIASLHDGAGDVQIVDVRNDGALPDLPDSAVVEVPARIDRDGAHPLPLAPLAPEQRGLVQAVKAYEELTVAAATSRRSHDGRPGTGREPARGARGRRAHCSRRCSRRTGSISTASPLSEPGATHLQHCGRGRVTRVIWRDAACLRAMSDSYRSQAYPIDNQPPPRRTTAGWVAIIVFAFLAAVGILGAVAVLSVYGSLAKDLEPPEELTKYTCPRRRSSSTAPARWSWPASASSSARS